MTIQDSKRKPSKGLYSILIIEDERFLCDLLRKKLENSGLEVRGALDGETGLKDIEIRKPDLILLDLLLPGMDGFEVLRRLKKDERFQNIPVLIISNLSEPNDVAKARKEGAEDYLIKANFSPQMIADKVWEYLNKSPEKKKID